MWKSKLKYKLREMLPAIGKHNIKLGISVERVVSYLLLTSMCIFILSGIYSSIENGIENYAILKENEANLEELRKENAELKEAVEYYQSDFYRELYARESLNYAQNGQQLFKVERREDYVYEEENTDPIIINNNRDWWMRLIL